jgi:hypothetical protein
VSRPADSLRLLAALPLDDKHISPRAAYRLAGLSVRAGNAALGQLRQAGYVDGAGRWIVLTDIGREAAVQLPRNRLR